MLQRIYYLYSWNGVGGKEYIFLMGLPNRLDLHVLHRLGHTVLTALALCLGLLRSGILGKLLGVRKEFRSTGDIFPQRLGNVHALKVGIRVRGYKLIAVLF